MKDPDPEPPSTQQVAGPADRRGQFIQWATWIGVLIAFVGLADGLFMALERKEAPCPDGKSFPEGTTDFTCYVHPQDELGVAIAAISVLLGILIVLAGIAARASLDSSSAPRSSSA